MHGIMLVERKIVFWKMTFIHVLLSYKTYKIDM